MTEAFSDIPPVLERTSREPPADDLESLADEGLLRRYRDTRETQAFAEMVRRHQPMVYRTCLRLVGNVHDAEDATQSVFLVLSQRPEVVRQSLAGCLHELARAAVSELCRSGRRRSQREEMAARINSLFRRLRGGPQPMEHQELREELDAALTQLPDPLRQAVILRYLEGHSQQEAARQAGSTQVTMGWRSKKGLERLRTILSRRGVVVAPATLVALLSAEAQATAALKLASLALGTGSATATATRVAQTLVRQYALSATLRKGALVALLTTAALGLGAGIVWLPQGKKDPPAHRARDKSTPGPTLTVASPLGGFEGSEDIGGPKKQGSVRVSRDTYVVQGGGQHIYGEKDQFRFVYRSWKGDGEIIARVANKPNQDAGQVMAGVMFREDRTPTSRHVAVLLDVRGGCHVKFRNAPNGGSGCHTIERKGKEPPFGWVRLVRRGKTFTSYVRPDAALPWQRVHTLDLPLGPSLYVGLAVTAHDDKQLATTTFDRVSVERQLKR
jgi:RNA polymerase sigma factor (sigma-70 family)